MRKIVEIALTELKTIFFSPVAWLILIVFTIQSADVFSGWFMSIVRIQEANGMYENLTFRFFGMPSSGLYARVVSYLYLYIPLLTMGLMSSELSSGSIKLLYSSPVRNVQIILGKYLSMLIFGLCLCAILFVYVIWGQLYIDHFDLPVALSGLLGVYLLICAYAAIGLFVSSLTSYQIVACVGTLAILAGLNFVSRIGQGVDVIRDITYWFAIGNRPNEAIGGLLCSEDILYFLIVIAMFIMLTVLRLQSIRQKSGWKTSISKYMAVLLVAVTLGYITSRPAFMFFFDTTETKQRSLTAQSQQIVDQLKGGLTITTYVNILDDSYFAGTPKMRISDIERFEQYTRFKPEIKMKYVYYYQNTGNPSADKRYAGLTDIERVEKIANSQDLNPAMFKPYEQIKDNVPAGFDQEGFRFVRVLERESGEKTFLRIYNDMPRFPFEAQISAAMRRLVTEVPVVGFLGGHGERDIDIEGDRGYFLFSKERQFRYAMINQGFDCEKVTLDREIPAHISILVIADMRQEMTPVQEANLDAYIARGGNLIIAGEPRRQDAMNPLAARFGVCMLPGQLVKQASAKAPETEVNATISPSQAKEQPYDYQADFIISYPTAQAGELSYFFAQMSAAERVVTMPGCVGLEYDAGYGFSVTPLAASDTVGSWNELQTTDFVDGAVTMDPSTGEVEMPHPTALALTRDVNGKEQKIIVLGDADCLSNAEINIQRMKVRGANYDMINGIFSWMTGDQYPVDVRREAVKDNHIDATKAQAKTSKTIMSIVIPSVLLIVYLLIWIRRRNR